MSKLDELIAEFCPEGVEYTEFKTVCKYIRGITYKKTKEVTPGTPGAWKVLRANNISHSTKSLNFEGMKFVSNEVKVSEEQKLKKGDILVCAGSGSKEHIGKSVYISNEMERFTFGSFMAVIRCSKELNSRYFFHILTSRLFSKYLDITLNTSTINNLNASILSKFRFPLPPLPVQQEIIRILDTFTGLNKELNAELFARRKQYEYYREEFFGGNYDEMVRKAQRNNVKLVPLHELGKFIRGKRFVRKDMKEEGEVPCIHYGDLYTYYGLSTRKTKWHLDEEIASKMRFAEKNDVIIVQAGENKEDIGIGVAWLGDKKVAVHDACYIFKHNINPKYISHYLRTNVYNWQIRRYVAEGKICSISAENIGRALIPVPSLDEQERIVSILDKFDVLINAPEIGIPVEIEARQKQYEYYLNRLLDFKEVPS